MGGGDKKEVQNLGKRSTGDDCHIWNQTTGKIGVPQRLKQRCGGGVSPNWWRSLGGHIVARGKEIQQKKIAGSGGKHFLTPKKKKLQVTKSWHKASWEGMETGKRSGDSKRENRNLPK